VPAVQVLGVGRPQLAVLATQLPPTQQPAAQVEPSQHGCDGAVPPQLFTIPLSQTMPLVDVGLVPDAKQTLPAQQPPPPQVEPGQQGCPGAPHTAQAPPLHMPPLAQVVPLLTQVEEPGSQQPVPPHLLLAQQG